MVSPEIPIPSKSKPSDYQIALPKFRQGNPFAEQSITFNINGVFYNRTTDSAGIAHLNINLQAGVYIITSSYNGCNIANKVTVTSE